MSGELALVHSQIMTCINCELHKSRTRSVPGEGPSDAKIMFVGEGPGQNEDLQGRPFVGAAGKLLTELLESVGISRSSVFITNIVKCRPPNNRAPRKSEIEACNPYLARQIELIGPRVVCALGTPAINALLGEEYSASKAHGKAVSKNQYLIFPMYHPAAALYDANLRQVLEADFGILKKLLDDLNSREDPQKGRDHARGAEKLESWA